MILTEWRRSRSGGEPTLAPDTVALPSCTGVKPVALEAEPALMCAWPNPWKRSALDFDEAVTSHRAWRQRLTHWLGGDPAQPLDHDTVSRDDCCQLGQWLTSEGLAVHGESPKFQQLRLAHTHFHRAAAAVVRHHKEGRSMQAREALRTGSFPMLSVKLQSLILGFRIETELARFRTRKPAQPAPNIAANVTPGSGPHAGRAQAAAAGSA